MAGLLIINATIIGVERTIGKGWLFVSDGKIAAMGSSELPDVEDVRLFDAAGLILLPGFIDVHVHGAMDADTMDGTLAGLEQMAEFYATQGVTGFLPTTLTDSHENILAALEAIKGSMQLAHRGAAVLGAHLEGPYINARRAGAQDTDYIRLVDKAESMAYLDMDVIRLISLAPEFDENRWLIREAIKHGVTVSAAHTDASYEQMWNGISDGISHLTHTFNAMPALHHREPGALGAIFEAGHVYCELIADNIHVHPAMMNLLWQIKGEDRVMLVTDSMRATGMPEGQFRLGHYLVDVADGRAVLHGGTSLAGSLLTMREAVLNMMMATGEPIDTMWKAASLNPARSINIAHRKGSIEIGKDADLILADRDLNIRLTVVMGEVVYNAFIEGETSA